MQTIDEARKMLFDDEQSFRQGQDCPACDQHVKLYSRPMTSTPVRMLWNLYKMDQWEEKTGSTKKYHYVGDLVVIATGTSDFSKLRYWGLIVEMKKDDSDTTKRTSGYYAITEKGKRFVEGSETVPSHVLLYNSKCYGFEGNHITFKQVLPKSFNYEEMMEPYRKGEPEQAILL